LEAKAITFQQLFFLFQHRSAHGSISKGPEYSQKCTFQAMEISGKVLKNSSQLSCQKGEAVSC
jgi:hypothetical protein